MTHRLEGSAPVLNLCRLSSPRVEFSTLRVLYGAKGCGWNPRPLHSFKPKGLSGREREGKTDKRSAICVDDSPKYDPSSCRVDQKRANHGGVFSFDQLLHTVSSKATGKLAVSLQALQ